MTMIKSILLFLNLQESWKKFSRAGWVYCSIPKTEVYDKTPPICLLCWLWEFLLIRWCKRFHRTQCHLREERKLMRGVQPNKQAKFARFPPKAGEQKDKQLRFCLQSPEFILLPIAQDHSPAFFLPSPLSCCSPHGGWNFFSIPWVCLNFQLVLLWCWFLTGSVGAQVCFPAQDLPWPQSWGQEFSTLVQVKPLLHFEHHQDPKSSRQDAIG